MRIYKTIIINSFPVGEADEDFAQETLKRLLPGQGFLKRGYPLDKSHWTEISPVDTAICLLNNWGQIVFFFS